MFGSNAGLALRCSSQSSLAIDWRWFTLDLCLSAAFLALCIAVGLAVS